MSIVLLLIAIVYNGIDYIDDSLRHYWLSRRELNEKEWQVLEYVKANPDQNKAQIADGMSNHYSRIPILNALRTLEDYGMITVKKENRQFHRVVANDNNLLLRVSNDINDFKEMFFVLLNKIKYKPIKSFLVIRKRAKLPEGHSLLSELYIIYHQFIRVFLFQAMTKWSKQEVLDKRTLARLYDTIFPIILSIQLKLSEVVDRIPSTSNEKIILRSNELISYDKTLLRPALMSMTVKTFASYGLAREVKPVLLHLAKMSVNYGTLFKFKEDWDVGNLS